MEEQRQLQLICPKHDGYILTHGCSYVDCERDPLFCSQCLFDQLDHANEQRQFIFPLSRFIIELYQNMQSVKEGLRQYEEVYLNRNNHQKFYAKFIQEQKSIINREVDQVISSFTKQIQDIHTSSIGQLDQIENKLDQNYQQLADVFENSELMNLSANHHMELVMKLNNMPSSQCVSYINGLRNSMQMLRDQNNNSKRSMNKLVTNIQQFKKKQDVFNQLDIVSVLHKSIKQIYQEMEDRLQKYIYEVVQPEQQGYQQSHLNQSQQQSQIKGYQQQQNSANKSNNNNSFQKYSPSNKYQQQQQSPSVSRYLNYNQMQQSPVNSQKYQQDGFNKSNVSPSKFNRSNNQPPSPNNYNQTMKSFNQSPTNSFINKNQQQQQNQQKQSRINNEINQDRLQVNLENLYEVNDNLSALCCIQVAPGIVAVGCKDSTVKVFEYQNGQIKLLTIYQYSGNQDQGIWSLAKLSTNNQRYHLFAAGQENGNILIWQYDQSCSGTMQQNPIMVLQGSNYMEIVTSLLDLGNNLLMSGDSNGQLLVWNFMSGQLENKFNVHSGQINCLLNHNDGFIAGSYDGQISIWSVQSGKCNMIKLIQNNFYIYALNVVENSLVILDNEKKVKLMDLGTYQYTKQSSRIFSNEPILDSMVVNTPQQSYIMAFGKTSLAILNRNLEVVQFFNNTQMYNNNIGFTMNTCHKVVNMNNGQNAINFGIIDQSNQTSRILSVFGVTY